MRRGDLVGLPKPISGLTGIRQSWKDYTSLCTIVFTQHMAVDAAL